LVSIVHWQTKATEFIFINLLGHAPVQASESQLTVWRNMQPPSSGSKRTLSEVSQKMSPYAVLYSFTLLLALISSLGTPTQACLHMCYVFPHSVYSACCLSGLLSTLKIETVQSSEMLVTLHETTQHHIPHDSILPCPSLQVGEKLNVLA
jgi:hypothetical protein